MRLGDPVDVLKTGPNFPRFIYIEGGFHSTRNLREFTWPPVVPLGRGISAFIHFRGSEDVIKVAFFLERKDMRAGHVLSLNNFIPAHI